jgi:F-type H+-transporting ATPase subunit gamma
MASLKDIKRQIKSVKNTQKTTKAMKLVSTSKLKKAEQVAKRSREYADKITETLREIAYKVQKYYIYGTDSRYIANKDDKIKMVDILFITADKGLCGGFNIQTINRVRALIEEYKKQNVKVRLRAIGKKGIEYFNFQRIELLASEVGVSSSPSYDKAQKIIAAAVEDFENGLTDKVVLVHNGYKNMITQELKVTNLLPIDTSDIGIDEVKSESFIELEPDDKEEVLGELIKKYIEFNMYFALIDSSAAEHSARMQAMDSATNNAKEKVEKLTIAYNKARQESITTELIEIISGMESMK